LYSGKITSANVTDSKAFADNISKFRQTIATSLDVANTEQALEASASEGAKSSAQQQQQQRKQQQQQQQHRSKFSDSKNGVIINGSNRYKSNTNSSNYNMKRGKNYRGNKGKSNSFPSSSSPLPIPSSSFSSTSSESSDSKSSGSKSSVIFAALGEGGSAGPLNGLVGKEGGSDGGRREAQRTQRERVRTKWSRRKSTFYEVNTAFKPAMPPMLSYLSPSSSSSSTSSSSSFSYSSSSSSASRPELFYRTLKYDHLASNSLRGIEVMPSIQFAKGDKYLTRWWDSAKKWGLLTGELKELDEEITKAAAAAASVNVTRRGEVGEGKGGREGLVASSVQTLPEVDRDADMSASSSSSEMLMGTDAGNEE